MCNARARHCLTRFFLFFLYDYYVCVILLIFFFFSLLRDFVFADTHRGLDLLPRAINFRKTNESAPTYACTYTQRRRVVSRRQLDFWENVRFREERPRARTTIFETFPKKIVPHAFSKRVPIDRESIGGETKYAYSEYSIDLAGLPSFPYLYVLCYKRYEPSVCTVFVLYTRIILLVRNCRFSNGPETFFFS